MNIPRWPVIFFACAAVLCGFSSASLPERTVTIQFNGRFGDQSLRPGIYYHFTNAQDSAAITVCRFYISHVELLQGEQTVATYDYKLMDLFDSSRTQLHLKTAAQGKITTLRFYLGIDSTTNADGAGAGELDPTKGMYWAWQSGFINLKLEGTSNRSSDPQRLFDYHLGGYLPPNNALQHVTLTVKDDRIIHVGVNVAELLLRADLQGSPHVMSPSVNAVQLAQSAVHMFHIEP